MDRIRVLVVDDSAFARKVLREVLQRRAGIEVVGIARDGLEALEKIAELHPDVVTLDLVMPQLDGLGVLRSLPPDGPRVLAVSISGADSELGLEALAAGAIDLVQKPTALATDRLYELSTELVAKVEAAAGARAPLPEPSPPPRIEIVPRVARQTRVVVVGTSTGGPQALTRLAAALPRDFPVPVVAALHIPEGYTESLARRLDGISALHVVEASHDAPLEPGTMMLARGGTMLTLAASGDRLHARLGEVARPVPFAPSVDLLFESAVQACGAHVMGVVLTGMGDDGLRGARAIRGAGGVVLTEASDSCIVDGMPRSVREAGLSNGDVPLDDIAAEIVRRA